jgi:hypothetical protein
LSDGTCDVVVGMEAERENGQVARGGHETAMGQMMASGTTSGK